MIYVWKQEGLYQNKVNYSLASTTRPLRSDIVICASPRFGHLHSQTVVIWASPSNITLAAEPTLRVLNLTNNNELPFLRLQIRAIRAIRAIYTRKNKTRLE